MRENNKVFSFILGDLEPYHLEPTSPQLSSVAANFSSLSAVINSQNLQTKPSKFRGGHMCGMCNKIFPCKAKLVIHERIHTGERPYVCSTCGKAFNQKGSLKIHMVTHLKNQ